MGGVPWTGQNDPAIKHGFEKVMILCVVTLVLVFLCFLFPELYTRITAWRRRREMKRSWSTSRRSLNRRTERGSYFRI